MADYELFQIEITKNYTTVEWRDDLKRVQLCYTQYTCIIVTTTDVIEGWSRGKADSIPV